MKKLLLSIPILFLCIASGAQTGTVEATVRALDEQTMKAAITKDTATLLKYWSADYTVNNPMNKIEKGGQTTLDRPIMNQLEYVSFERNVEHAMVKGDVVLLMGSEVVVPKGKDGTPGRTINRRFTNIWQKQGSEWKLIARHANEICNAR